MDRGKDNILHISNFISKRFHKVLRFYVYGYLGGDCYMYEVPPGWKHWVSNWLFFGIEFSWMPKVI